MQFGLEAVDWGFHDWVVPGWGIIKLDLTLEI